MKNYEETRGILEDFRIKAQRSNLPKCSGNEIMKMWRLIIAD